MEDTSSENDGEENGPFDEEDSVNTSSEEFSENEVLFMILII